MKKKTDLIIGIVLIASLMFITIGYASYEKLLELNGNITLFKPGVVTITSITEKTGSSDLPTGSGSLKLQNGEIVLDYHFTVSGSKKNYSATYLIRVDNYSPYDYTFSGFNIEPEVTLHGATEQEATAVLTYEYVDEVTEQKQVLLGETISSKDYGIIAVTIHFYVASENSNTSIIVGGGASVNTTTDNSGNIYGAVIDSPVSLDLSGGKTSDCFDVEVTNTYKTEQSYYFSLTSNNFNIVNETGGSLGTFTIAPPSEDSESNVSSHRFCLTLKEDSIFTSATAKTQVVINPTGLSNFSIGTLNVKVDYDENLSFEGYPEVADLSFSLNKYDASSSSLLTTLSWSRVDTDAVDVEKWFIDLYSTSGSGNDTLIKTFEISGDQNISNYQLELPSSVLNDEDFVAALNAENSFYVNVYGKYANLDDASSYCGTSSEYCASSTAISLDYEFTLTYSGNATMSGFSGTTTTVYLNNAFSTTITSASGYALTGVTVVMGTGDTAETFTNNTQYVYALDASSSTTASFNILENYIKDDITVTISATYTEGCLIKGTKIKVYGGYKNIEDITYSDLLSVYSYDLGREVYEYPIEIEQSGITDKYLRISFSDGSILETYNDHGIFSKDFNRYVSVLNRNEFNIGSNILKFIDGKFKVVKVVNIEEINEKTTYYNISSTRYLNVISNDFITTDPLLPISNNFKFDDNLMWGKDREDYLKTNDFISYDMLKDYFPRYLYDGIRMGEAKNLLNKGIITISNYVSRFHSIPFVPVMTDKKGNNLWMVTNTNDLLFGNKGNFYIEGSYYILPFPNKYLNKKFIGWYNTSDNKYYLPGDKVRVSHGMFFEAVYENIN